MEEFKRILAEEVSDFYSKTEGEAVTVEEILEDMYEALPELEALFKAAERWAETRNKKLIQYRDTTVGLWATDRPLQVIDRGDILFQLKYKD